jgi:hypothetical protein
MSACDFSLYLAGLCGCEKPLAAAPLLKAQVGYNTLKRPHADNLIPAHRRVNLAKGE